MRLTTISFFFNNLWISGSPSPQCSTPTRSVEEPNRIGDRTRTEVHVLLLRREIAMTRELLDRARWRAFHRQMRAERVTQNVRPVGPNVSATTDLGEQVCHHVFHERPSIIMA